MSFIKASPAPFANQRAIAEGKGARILGLLAVLIGVGFMGNM